jgi:D-alanyl-D-alanine carboxypeptidase (penicillin-binding protein 5/6)
MASSAYDLALLFRIALTKPLFASTIATRMVPFPGYGDKPGFMLGNNDRFVPSYDGAIAAKSGFTDAARHTLVATAQRGNRRLVVALMRGEQHPVTMVAQASALLDLGFATPPSAPAVGTLVDRPPAPPTSAPVTAPPPAAPAGPSETPRWTIWGGVGAVALLVAAVVVGLVRRRAHR